MSHTISKPAQWNAADYAANSVVQQTWARELIVRLQLRGNEHILDVGCGDGKVTAEIARALPRGAATGIDASPQMIEFAQNTFPPDKFPNLDFQVLDAREITAEHFSLPQHSERRSPTRQASMQAVEKRVGAGTGAPFDLVFSNAALHWIEDHQAFLQGAASVLKTGGRLVVSCGGKGNAQDVFVAARPEMRLKHWRQFFRRMPKPYFFYTPADYKKWLPRVGFKILDVRLAPKDATYAGRDGFAAWMRTTWLPYVQRVPENVREEFIAGVTNRYVTKHPPDAEGRVHVHMVRLEINAVRN